MALGRPVSEPATLTGGCQCGRVRYRAQPGSRDAYFCHCRMCRRATGGAAAALVSIAQEDVEWIGSPPDHFRSSPIVERGFCALCGSPLSFAYLDSADMDLTLGSFDRPDFFRPVEHVACETILDAWLDTGHLPRRMLTENRPLVDRWMRAVGKLPD